MAKLQEPHRSDMTECHQYELLPSFVLAGIMSGFSFNDQVKVVPVH